MPDFLPSLMALADAVENGLHAEALTLTRCVVKHLQRDNSHELRIHPLGFLMLNIGLLPDHRQLRLHLWIPGFRVPQDPNWPIHDHAFSYTSCVLAGSLMHVVHDVCIGHDGDRPVYSVTYDAQCSILTRSGQFARIKRSSSAEHLSGTTYRLQHQIFHETHVMEHVFTATTMLATPVAGIQPRVLGALDGGPAYRFVRAVLDQRTIQKWLELPT